MTTKAKFISTSTWILLTRSYDVYCTNEFTPDLSNEANPLVSVFGMNWTPLLIVLALLSIYALYTFYLSVFKPLRLLPTEKGYSFSEMTAYNYLGWKDNWTAIFYKFPKDLNRFNQYMGQTLTSCLVYAGFVSTIMWLLLKYTSFYKEVHSAFLVYSFLIGGCALINYYWNKKMYKSYLMSTQ